MTFLKEKLTAANAESRDTMDIRYLDISWYNTDEIKEALDVGHDISDTTLFLLGYERWGGDFFNRLNADFAVVLHDPKKKRLVAARDCLGMRSLYYVEQGGEFFFSPDIDELFELAGLQKKIRAASVRSILDHGAVDYEETMYEKVRRVPPGHYVAIDKGILRLVRYWFPEKICINYSISFEEACKKFFSLFKNAVQSRLDDLSETAFELSGGLDSSSIVALANADYPGQSINTFSLRFSRCHCDESNYIQAFTEKKGVQLHLIEGGDFDYRGTYTFAHMYTISPHWPITSTYATILPLLEAIREQGKSVVVTGQGGDHVCTGGRFTAGDLLRRGRLFDAFVELLYCLPFPVRFRDLFIPVLGMKGKRRIKQIFRSLPFTRKEKSSMFQDLFHLKEIESPLLFEEISFLLSPRQVTLWDTVFPPLEKKFGVRFRHPFFDKQLIEYALTLPPEYKRYRGGTKVILKSAMQEILPERIRKRRGKVEFSELLVQQIQTLDLHLLFTKSFLITAKHIKCREIKKMIAEFESKKYNQISRLWRAINLEIWMKETSNEVEI